MIRYSTLGVSYTLGEGQTTHQSSLLNSWFISSSGSIKLNLAVVVGPRALSCLSISSLRISLPIRQ